MLSDSLEELVYFGLALSGESIEHRFFKPLLRKGFSVDSELFRSLENDNPYRLNLAILLYLTAEKLGAEMLEVEGNKFKDFTNIFYLQNFVNHHASAGWNGYATGLSWAVQTGGKILNFAGDVKKYDGSIDELSGLDVQGRIILMRRKGLVFGRDEKDRENDSGFMRSFRPFIKKFDAAISNLCREYSITILKVTYPKRL